MKFRGCLKTPERNEKGTVLGGFNWKIKDKWAENDTNQSIFEEQGGLDKVGLDSGVPAGFSLLTARTQCTMVSEFNLVCQYSCCRCYENNCLKTIINGESV